MDEALTSLETVENRTFEEIAAGDTAQLERRLNEHDIDLFAAVSDDLNPTQLSPDYPRPPCDSPGGLMSTRPR